MSNPDRRRRAVDGIVAALACGSLATVCAGADLFVGGTIGEVYLGDSHTGGFGFFGGICLAPVHSLAIDDQFIFVGDSNGGILRLDASNGDFLDLFWVPGDATDIVTHEGDILVSTSAGDVHRVDPLTGLVEDTMTSPISIQAMALDGDDLFIAGTVGEVYKGNAVHGGFALFGDFCLQPIQALAIDDEALYAGDVGGGVIRFDVATGGVLEIYFSPDGVTGLVREGDDLLASAFTGEIHRLDAVTGAWIATLVAPLDVQAMEIVFAAGDLDTDGFVATADLLALLAAWGPCGKGNCPADLNGDGAVATQDLLTLLTNWG